MLHFILSPSILGIKGTASTKQNKKKLIFNAQQKRIMALKCDSRVVIHRMRNNACHWIDWKLFHFVGEIEVNIIWSRQRFFCCFLFFFYVHLQYSIQLLTQSVACIVDRRSERKKKTQNWREMHQYNVHWFNFFS